MTVLPFRRLLPALAGLVCLFSASCKSTKKSDYSGVVDYTTPETNLSQEEYPFDEHGNYLADVVSGKKKGRRNKKIDPPKNDADYGRPPEPVLATTSPNYETPPSPASNSAYAPVYSSGGSGSGSTGTKYSSGRNSGGSSATKKSTASSSSSRAKARPKPVARTKAKPKPKAPSTMAYTVKRGDTLYSLANRYGTSVAAIKKASGLSSDLLRDGRTLRIPRK